MQKLNKMTKTKNNIAVSRDLYADMTGIANVYELEKAINSGRAKIHPDKRKNSILLPEAAVKEWLKEHLVIGINHFMQLYEVRRKRALGMIRENGLRTYTEGATLYVVVGSDYYKENHFKLRDEGTKFEKKSNCDINLSQYRDFSKKIKSNRHLREMGGQLELYQFNELTEKYKAAIKKTDAKLSDLIDFVIFRKVNNSVYDSVVFHIKSLQNKM